MEHPSLLDKPFECYCKCPGKSGAGVPRAGLANRKGENHVLGSLGLTVRILEATEKNGKTGMQGLDRSKVRWDVALFFLHVIV